MAWRKVKRRIWKLPCNTHDNAIVQNLTYNIDDQLDVRIAKFTHMCLNHHNDVCRSISLSKLLCKNSTFASNYRYLSCKYSLSHHDWHLDMNHLAGNVRLKNQQKSIYSRSWQDIIELCEIRDRLSSCDTLSNDDIEVGRILFIYRKNSTKKDKENKTKQRKTMYSEQLYTITILALNKSIQAVQLIY